MNLANGEAMDEKNEHRLRPGEVVSLSETLLSTDTRKATQSVWIRADREGESKQTYKNGVLFVLNNHRFPKWLYSYDSSVTRPQREMTHHLVVYICQLTGTRSQPGDIDVAVLARHESPGFSLISYRRSGNNGSDAGCDLPAIDVASTTKFTAVDFDSPGVFPSPASEMEIDSVGWASAEPSTRTNEEIHANTYRFQQGQEENKQKQFDNKSAFPLRGGTEDKYLWQYRLAAINCGFREKGQHLLILWRFLQNHSLRDLKFTEAASTQVRSFCFQAAASFRSPNASPLHYAVGSLLSSIFKHSSATYMDRECTIIRVTAHLFLRALSSHTVQRLVLSASTRNEEKTSKLQLQERFLLLISDVYDALGGILHEVLAESGSFTRGNQHVSIPTLVDEVLSLVYIQPRFRHLRVGFVALLMDQRPVGSLSETLNCAFQAFTALIREGMIASVTRSRNSRRLGVNDLIWNRRWLLEPGLVQLLELSPGSPKDYRHEMRLVDAMQLISELGCVDFTVEDDASGLSVRSAVSMSASACMTLVLDGKLRVFRVLPSGISSMIATTGGWSIGDYTAAFAEDGRSLEVNLFSFAESMSNGLTPGDAQSINSRSSASDGTVKLRRVSLLIRLEQEFNKEATGSTVQRDLCAFVHGTVYGSTLSLPLNECRNGFKLSERSAVDRAATWSEVEWAALWELKAVYITLSRAFS
ncbi:hypothetical protein PI125_g24470 [Phytophthora idaei]|nr:hypothetical protein PI125_g24470 [Phytophthora idaei]